MTERTIPLPVEIVPKQLEKTAARDVFETSIQEASTLITSLYAHKYPLDETDVDFLTDIYRGLGDAYTRREDAKRVYGIATDLEEVPGVDMSDVIDIYDDARFLGSKDADNRVRNLLFVEKEKSGNYTNAYPLAEAVVANRAKRGEDVSGMVDQYSQDQKQRLWLTYYEAAPVKDGRKSTLSCVYRNMATDSFLRQPELSSCSLALAHRLYAAQTENIVKDAVYLKTMERGNTIRLDSQNVEAFSDFAISVLTDSYRTTRVKKEVLVANRLSIQAYFKKHKFAQEDILLMTGTQQVAEMYWENPNDVQKIKKQLKISIRLREFMK